MGLRQWRLVATGTPRHSRRTVEHATRADSTDRAADPLADQPGFDGYIALWHVVDDRGTFFTPGSFKKTLRERTKVAPILWPEKSVQAAHTLLLDCFNPERPAHLSLDHAVLILRMVSLL